MKGGMRVCGREREGSVADEIHHTNNLIVPRGIHFAKCLPCTYRDMSTDADSLDMKCAEIDAVVAKRRKQLEGLADYRKGMIYAYVTGKKEVAV